MLRRAEEIRQELITGLAKAGGQRNEIDDKTGKRVIFQHGGGQDMGVLAD